MNLTALRERALFVATHNIGYGESTRNNEGHFLKTIGCPEGLGREWCAYFMNYCYRHAAELEGVVCPFQLYRGKALEPSAKRLVKNLADFGSHYTDPMLARPGDLICWAKPNPLDWHGHVGMVERVDPDGIVHTIEGNVGRFPAKVKRLSHDVSKERLYMFASLHDG